MDKRVVPSLMMEKKKIHLGIKIISIIFFVFSLFLLVFSIILFFGFGLLQSAPPQYFPFLGTHGQGIVMGVVLLLIAGGFFFIGLDLWRRKKWARIAALVFMIIGFIGSISNIVTGRWSIEDVVDGRWLSLASLIFYGGIGAYLIFSRKVKDIFGRLRIYKWVI
jgi:hypothetical protein